MALTDSLELYYKLDSNSNDSSSNSNDGGDTDISYSNTGKIGNCATFNGTTSRIITESNIVGTSTFTVAGWFYFNGLGTTALFGQRDEFGGTWATYIRDSGKIGITVSGTADYDTGTQNITTGSFIHIVYVINGTNVKAYVNNTKIWDTTTASITTVAGKLTIGNSNTAASGGGMNGRIDEIGFWSKCLSATEISELYNSGNGLTYPLEVDLTNSLVSYWKLDESSGNAADSVGSYTLTNVGTATYSAGKINNGVNTESGKYLTNTTFLDAGLADWTCSVWIKTSANYSGGSAFFIDKESSGSNYSYPFELLINTSNKIELINKDSTNFTGSLNRWTSSSTVNDGNWHHIVLRGSRSGGRASISMYIDGSLNGSLDLTDIDSGGIAASTYCDFYIGRRSSSSTPFIGQIDEIGWRSRVITTDEITTLYNGGNGLQYPFTGTGIQKIYLGATQLKSFKLGSTDIKKIYLGSTQVFSK